MRRNVFLSGGAAGYCPRVQPVTDYSSTDIVLFYFLQLVELENRQKYPISCVVRFSFI